MNLPHAEAELRQAILGLKPPANPCHRCGQPGTVQWRRNATDAEAEQHWTAVEQHIRSQPNLSDSSNADYVADRGEQVVKAVFGCDEHNLAPEPVTDHDGSDGAVAEAARMAEQAGLEARALTHDADCGGHGACQCSGAA